MTEHATSIEGFQKIARQIWRRMALQYLEAFQESMPRQMTAVNQANGGRNKY